MTSTADSFAPFRLSFKDLPEKNRADVLREIYGRTMLKHEIELMTDDPPQLDMTLRALPGLGISSVACSSTHLWRTRAQVDSDDVVLNVTLAGKRNHNQCNREAEITAGEAVLATCADIGDTIVSTGTRFVSFRLARNVIAPMAADLDDCLVRRIPKDTEALRLLVNYAAVLQDAHALATAELRNLAVTHIYDLAALSIGATHDAMQIARGRGVRAARLNAVKTYILANITRGGLSIDAVARRHGISAIYVRKLLKGDGTTFTDFILTQRLARAHRALCDPRSADSKISAIAYESGFSDLSYFNRVFRRRYGLTPSDVREQARREEDM
jgi:AraC-like DNA-binding protein